MRALCLLLLAASVAAAGCLGGDASTPSGPTDDSTVEPVNMTVEPVVKQTQGAIAAGAGTPVASFQNGGTSHVFTVPANATAMLVEVTWDSDVMDLDLALKEPGTDDPLTWQHQVQQGTPGAPDNPHSLLINGPMTGEWEATVFPNGAAAQVSFTIYSTVFFGPVPDGYTAIV